MYVWSSSILAGFLLCRFFISVVGSTGANAIDSETEESKFGHFLGLPLGLEAFVAKGGSEAVVVALVLFLFFGLSMLLK